MYLYQGTDLIAKAENLIAQAETTLNGIEGPHDPQMDRKLSLVGALSNLSMAFLELNEAFDDIEDDAAEEDTATGY